MCAKTDKHINQNDDAYIPKDMLQVKWNIKVSLVKQRS